MLRQLISGGVSGSSLRYFLLSFCALVFSLCVHEWAHAYTAHRLGDDTAREMGRMTLDPRRHLTLFGTLMMFSGLVGWARPVPFNPQRLNHRRSLRSNILLISGAGPLSNLILSFLANLIGQVVLLVATLLWKAGTITTGAFPFLETLLLFLQLMATLNIYLALFNLLPVPPLDGFKVFGILLPERLYYQWMRHEDQIGLFLLVIILGVPQILHSILGVLQIPFVAVLHTPINQLFQYLMR